MRHVTLVAPSAQTTAPSSRLPMGPAGQDDPAADDGGDEQLLSAEQVELALSTLVVRFHEGEVTWTLGTPTSPTHWGAFPPCADPLPSTGCSKPAPGEKRGWTGEHSAALLDALSSLAVISGIPVSTEAKHKAHWLAALSGLRVVRESLLSVPRCTQLCNSCQPGYAPDSTCRACLHFFLVARSEAWVEQCRAVLRDGSASPQSPAQGGWKLPGRSPASTASDAGGGSTPRKSSSGGLASEASLSRLTSPRSVAAAKPLSPRPQAPPALVLPAGKAGPRPRAASDSAALVSPTGRAGGSTETQGARSVLAAEVERRVKATAELQAEKQRNQALATEIAKAAKRAAELETELKQQRTRAAAAAEWAEREKQRLVAATAAAAAVPVAAHPPPAPVTLSAPPAAPDAAPSDLVTDLRLSAEAAWQRADALADELQTTADELQAVQAELAAERSARGGETVRLAVAHEAEVTPPPSPVHAGGSEPVHAALPEVMLPSAAPAGVPVAVAAITAAVAGALGALLGAAMHGRPEPKAAPKQGTKGSQR